MSDEITLRWYSLRVISGKERSIRDRIESEVKSCGWSEIVTQIIVPTERVFRWRNGKKVVQDRNILPGYILVEADSKRLKGDIAHHIAQMTNVIHFLGKENPLPMLDAEAHRLLGIVDDSMVKGEVDMERYITGDIIVINDGPFNNFQGEITAINEERKKLKVTVKIFGRPTEVELSYSQVERADLSSN